MAARILPLLLLNLLLISATYGQDNPVPDPEQGLRAEWMRGALGMLWLPESNYNGNIEGISIEPFLNQISHLKTVDYIQLPLTSPNIYSPVHVAPHPILESLWEGDRNANGKPINLIVPRATADDPLLRWLTAVKAAGLKTEIYVNSFNMLARNPDSPPGAFPDVSARWEEYCNTDPTVQAYINSQPYHTDGIHERRPYMFSYAEFILKDYAVRYGDLIDAWCFDSADNIMEGGAGDNPGSGNLEDQRVYQAFANAVHTGNPNAAVAFNNSVGTAARPFATPTLFEDYTFGHPFGGAGNMVETESLYNRNFGICEYMSDYNGHPFATRDDRAFNDNVVGHFFPKQSTTSWNAGAQPVLTDEQFVEWNDVGLIEGGAITWGTPLRITNLLNANAQANLILQDYALRQFELLDEHLMKFQNPGAPNWSRAETFLPTAYIGVPYSHSVVEGVDFWDPEGDMITGITAIGQPDWLIIKETGPGEWTFSGVPTRGPQSEFEFTLIVSDASGDRSRSVVLEVTAEETPTTFSSNVQIQAEADTDYGIDQVATMTSDLQTAPDGLATYRISVALKPASEKAIVSGESGGSSTITSFAVGTTNSDKLFTGSDNDWIESIGEIEIVGFNANGGLYSKEIMSTRFKSVVIANALSRNDNVAVKFGDLEIKYGKTPTNTYELDLESLTGGIAVNEFAVGTGNTSVGNNWSINGLIVTVVFDSSNLPIAVSGIDISSEDLLLNIGGNAQLDVVINPSNASEQTVIWSSNNQSIATVDANGLVTAVGEGNAIITATTEDGGFTDMTNITVSDSPVAVIGIELNPESFEMGLNATARIITKINPSNASNKNLEWSSSNENIAIVDANGLVTAHAEGTATITAKTEDGGFQGSSIVTVSLSFISVQSVTISPNELTLNVDATALLSAVISPANATNHNINWSSSNDDIATVDWRSGLVTALSEGITTITVITQDGSHSNQIIVLVNKANDSGKLTIYPNPVYTGETMFVNYDNENEGGWGNMIIFGPEGKRLITKSNEMKIGMNVMEVDTVGMSAGIYVLVMSDSTGYSEARIVLIK